MVIKGIPFSESSPNIPRTNIMRTSPMKPAKVLSKLAKISKVKKHKNKSGGSKLQPAHKKKKKQKPALKSISETAGVSKVVKKPKGDFSRCTIVTRAAIRRIAAKHDIPQISSECVDLIVKYLTETASTCLLRARSCAANVSRTRTIQVPDLASAARACGMGELIHA